MAKRYTVNTKRTYTKDGEEKTVWNRVGTITQFEDGFGFEWFTQPDTKFFVFEEKPREQGQSAQSNTVDDSGIPF